MGALGGGLKTIDWNSTRVEKFEKNFYNEDPRVTARSEREIEDFRNKHEIRVSDVFSSLFEVLLIPSSTKDYWP